MAEHALGRRPATDDRHLQRYSLTAETMPIVPTPVVIGINWYERFDEPIIQFGSGIRGVFWLTHKTYPDWGRVRGGHAICLKPPALSDLSDWWGFYDQGNEGACVGFAVSRMMTLLNRRRYRAVFLYHAAQQIDEFADTPPEQGTSVRAGCDVARKQGLWRYRAGVTTGPHPHDGIAENRWARSVEEVAACLSPADEGKRVLDAGYVEMLNSWGIEYPHRVRIDLESLNRLLFREEGDSTVITDR